jgi:hypothetical protein
MWARGNMDFRPHLTGSCSLCDLLITHDRQLFRNTLVGREEGAVLILVCVYSVSQEMWVTDPPFPSGTSLLILCICEQSKVPVFPNAN